jgi:choline dehydrogenase-like flavoprotein
MLLGTSTKYRNRDNDEDFMTIPGLAGGAVGTKYDWNTTYAANEFVGNRVVSIPQGKVVGGSTKLNRMVFDRGSKSDYDSWGALGNEGWQWDTLLPYFQKVTISQDNPNIACTDTLPDRDIHRADP